MRLAKTTIFIGSFLAFALEPLIGRTLLPVFGGTPSVWLTCLVAFQPVSYTHLTLPTIYSV